MKTLSAILILLICLAAFRAAPAAEKLYGGRTLEDWRARMVDFDADSTQAAAAAPALIEILSDESVDGDTRRSAALVLARMGAPAKSAVPVLVRLLGESDQQPEDAPYWAAKALAQFGPLARDATPQLVSALADEGRPLIQRQMCLESLAQIRGAHPDAVPAIVRIVNNNASSDAEDGDVAPLRASAVEALGIAGTDAAVAAPLLVRIVRNPRETESIRRVSASALGKMGSSANIAVEPLAEALVIDESQAVRDAAAEALAGLGPRGTAALLSFLKHDDASIRWRAANALGGVERPDENIVVALQAAARDDDEQVRLHAAASLWKIVADAEPMLFVVVNLLTSDDRNIRFRALELLEKFGPQAKPAEPRLKKLTSDQRQHVRRAAEQALRKLHESP